jgi:hypothetical protein
LTGRFGQVKGAISDPLVSAVEDIAITLAALSDAGVDGALLTC